jgi:hypothetical protein
MKTSSGDDDDQVPSVGDKGRPPSVPASRKSHPRRKKPTQVSDTSPRGVDDSNSAQPLDPPILEEATSPLLEHERTFLRYQRQLKEGGTKVLTEAMLVLDNIDVKAQSLLTYISVSLAALVFLITSPLNTPISRISFFGIDAFTQVLLILILALIGASILCLSCLNIVGAHTIRSLASRNQSTPQGYESHIVRVTLGRRSRYLVAHRISIATAFLTFILFAAVFCYPLFIALRHILSFVKIPWR